MNYDAAKERLIWNNSYIRIKNKPVCFKNWITNGILSVQQFFDGINQFLDYENFKVKFKNPDICFPYFMCIKSETLKQFLKSLF